MPIRLWSTVVSQPRTPGLSFQIVSRRLRRTSVAAGAVTVTSAQLRQVGDDRVVLLLPQAQARHLRPRLDALRVLDPAEEVARRVGDRVGGEGFATGQVGQVRA